LQEEFSEQSILQCAGDLLVHCGLLSRAEAAAEVNKESCSRIAGDGSTRRFWRLRENGGCRCLIAAPAGASKAELAESRSAWLIGSHLRRKGVPVPEIYGWDPATGVLLFEDLGDLRLHDLVKQSRKENPGDDESIIDFYCSCLEMLARMQCAGSEGFDPSWCWDSSSYDRRIMVEKESGYFLRAFWQRLLGHEISAGVEEELKEIARLATEAPADFFLHRDFQSRNIMIKEAKVRFIDFQGGRFGPLGYDLASLLIDPYSRLSRSLQEELLAVYKRAVGHYIPLVEEEFNKHFTLLAFQRNMQIVGAFSFLSTMRNKPFFKDFIAPALLSLKERLEDPLFTGFPLIRTMVDRGFSEVSAAKEG